MSFTLIYCYVLLYIVNYHCYDIFYYENMHIVFLLGANAYFTNCLLKLALSSKDARSAP